MLERDSARDRARATRRSGCSRGGLRPDEVARRRARAPARGSCTPTTSTRRSGWRALAAAQGGRARGSCCTCTTTGSCARSARASRSGEDCTRCHGRNTLPGRAAQLPRRLASRVRRLRRRPRAVPAPVGRRRRRDRRPERVRAAAAPRPRRPARREGRVLGSVQREFATHSTAADDQSAGSQRRAAEPYARTTRPGEVHRARRWRLRRRALEWSCEGVPMWSLQTSTSARPRASATATV